MCLACRWRAGQILADRFAERPLRPPGNPDRLEWEPKVLQALTTLLDVTAGLDNPEAIAAGFERIASTMAMLDADDTIRLRELAEGMISRLTAVSQSVTAGLVVLASGGDKKAAAGQHQSKHLIWPSAASPVSESEPAARQFTIMCDWKLRRAGHDKVRSIPWSLIAPHEDCAKSNHGGQTLERLHERGGLCAAEALCVLKDLAWNRGAEGHRIASLPDADAQRELAELIVSAVSPSGGAPFPSDVMNGMTEHSKQSILRPGAPSPSGGAPSEEELQQWAAQRADDAGRLAAALLRERENHALLVRATNESTTECSSECDEHGHVDACPRWNTARWLTDQQRTIESERAVRLVAETRVQKYDELLAERHFSGSPLASGGLHDSTLVMVDRRWYDRLVGLRKR